MVEQVSKQVLMATTSRINRQSIQLAVENIFAPFKPVLRMAVFFENILIIIKKNTNYNSKKTYNDEIKMNTLINRAHVKHHILKP